MAYLGIPINYRLRKIVKLLEVLSFNNNNLYLNIPKVRSGAERDINL